MELPDWVAVGAEVAEQKHGEYTYTSVKRITDTQVVLANGSRYRRQDMRKFGEVREFNRTWLIRAEEARRDEVKSVIGNASTHVSQAAFRVTEYGANESEALDAMQAAIDEARRKLAELNH